jgi:hypothetical protein
MLEACADHPAQFVGEDDLILQVQRMAFDVFEEVGAGACAVGFRLAVNRLVDVDGVRAAGDGGDSLVLAVVLVLGADQQFVLPRCRVSNRPRSSTWVMLSCQLVSRSR